MRIDVLEFIRDHVDPSEVYLLRRDDLELGELLPEKPGWMEQDEYERDNGVRFCLERLTKEVGGLASGAYALACDGEGQGRRCLTFPRG